LHKDRNKARGNHLFKKRLGLFPVALIDLLEGPLYSW
jgi:hypothetical protein